MTRSRLSLDGTWQFWPDPGGSYTQDRLVGQPMTVRVPAPWQSQHAELRDYTGTGWYRRAFSLPPDWPDGGRVVLGFGAVDYCAEVWLNGVRVGDHENGYLPFELDVTGAARAGENLLTVKVSDPPEIFDEIPHGKQSWYGMISGLWQPVWVEARPDRYLTRALVTAAAEQVTVRVQTSAALQPGERLRLEILDPAGQVAAQSEGTGEPLIAQVTNPLLWDVGQPNLYTARITWLDSAGLALDAIEERFGFRTVETREGKIYLNGRPLYVRAALDQDYYPDLIYTPPSMEFIQDQFRKALEMGLNMLRIHIKVGDPRYYQAADELGLLLWTELPNWNLLSERSKAAARQTLSGMVERDFNHPSILLWTVINESWGVDLTNPEHRQWLVDTYRWMKELDPTRLVVGNSACYGNFQVATDIADFHNYYAMPDHSPSFAEWVDTYAKRPNWLFAFPYPGAQGWREFMSNPWRADRDWQHAPEVQCRGDEPLLVSEFGNWGLPDVAKLKEGYGGKDPWWFETGYEFGDGIVYPHGIEQRFRDLHLRRGFGGLSEFSGAHQRLQFAGMKYEIEQIRIHGSIQGYVITEFTDVHWECNGLLDMLRNPKSYYRDMGWLNADDLIIPEWERLALWSGEEYWLRLYFSHYSPASLDGSTLEWSLEGFPGIHGRQEGLGFAPYTVSPLGGLHFEIPAVTRPTRARLVLRVLNPAGEVAARNEVELMIFPYQRRLVDGVPVFLPDASLSGPLRELGCRIVAHPQDAQIAVTSVMTDDLREYVLGGGRVLWLAESAASRQTHLPGLNVVDRQGSPWQGDWASSVGWIYRDRLFRDLPGEGLVDFTLAGLTPEAVVAGVSPRLFGRDVQAGMAVGWLHKAAATIVERALGKGRLLVSTFRLSQALGQNPAANYLTAEMIRHLAGSEAHE